MLLAEMRGAYMHTTGFACARARKPARVLTLVILLFSSTATAGEGLSLRSVYKLRLPAPKKSVEHYARFDSTGEKIHLIEPDMVRVKLIDWRNAEEVEVRKYSDIPCSDSTPGMHVIHGWEPLNNGLILMRYCDSLYFLDDDGLNIKRTLQEGEELFGEILISPDGAQMALEVSAPDHSLDKTRIRIYDLNTLSSQAEWPVTDLVDFLDFSSDGRYLAAKVSELEPSAPGQKVRTARACRLISWHTDTWEVAAQKTLAEGGEQQDLDCPWRPRRIPGHNAFLDDGPVRVRDLRTGAVLKTIPFDGVLLEAVPSHNGRWVAATVKTNWPPDMGRSFRILDLQTGAIVYDQVLLGRSAVPIGFSWSPDDRHLLVTRPGEIEIYEVKH